jgi:hypothetical protein
VVVIDVLFAFEDDFGHGGLVAGEGPVTRSALAPGGALEPVERAGVQNGVPPPAVEPDFVSPPTVTKRGSAGDLDAPPPAS